MQAQLTMFPDQPEEPQLPTRQKIERCPFLGLSWDRDSTSMFATIDHRCFAGGRERRIERSLQAAVCLAAYVECSTYAKTIAAPVAEAVAANRSRETLMRYLLAVTLPVATFLITFALRWTGQF